MRVRALGDAGGRTRAPSSFVSALLVVLALSVIVARIRLLLSSSSTTMHAALARASLRPAFSVAAAARPARAFASSATRAQAVPTEKPVLEKTFKIYRWVCRLVIRPARIC